MEDRGWRIATKTLSRDLEQLSWDLFQPGALPYGRGSGFNSPSDWSDEG